jgi:hypothetical protein
MYQGLGGASAVAAIVDNAVTGTPPTPRWLLCFMGGIGRNEKTSNRSRRGVEPA